MALSLLSFRPSRASAELNRVDRQRPPRHAGAAFRQGDSAGRRCSPCKNRTGILADFSGQSAKLRLENDLPERRGAKRFRNELREWCGMDRRLRPLTSWQTQQRKQNDGKLHQRQYGGVRIPATRRFSHGRRRWIARHFGRCHRLRLPGGDSLPAVLGPSPAVVTRPRFLGVPAEAQQAQSDRAENNGGNGQSLNLLIEPFDHGRRSAGLNRFRPGQSDGLERSIRRGNLKASAMPGEHGGRVDRWQVSVN